MKIVIECKDCQGTGLYIGMAERDGAAVVCYRCKGKGWDWFEYKEFTERKPCQGVRRIYACNPGIIIGEGKLTSLESFGGLAPKDWIDGKPFGPGTEDRQHTCPAWFYQSCDHEKKPNWKECSDRAGMLFSRCKHFEDKTKCWKRWDKEIGGGMNDGQ